MTRRILLVAAEWLTHLADGGAYDIGVAGPHERYRRRESQQVGPLVSAIARSGAIAPAGAGPASRRTRHGSLVRRWAATDKAVCRSLAAEYRRQADLLPGDDDDEQQRQKTLF